MKDFVDIFVRCPYNCNYVGPDPLLVDSYDE